MMICFLCNLNTGKLNVCILLLLVASCNIILSKINHLSARDANDPWSYRLSGAKQLMFQQPAKGCYAVIHDLNKDSKPKLCPSDVTWRKYVIM